MEMKNERFKHINQAFFYFFSPTNNYNKHKNNGFIFFRKPTQIINNCIIPASEDVACLFLMGIFLSFTFFILLNQDKNGAFCFFNY